MQFNIIYILKLTFFIHLILLTLLTTSCAGTNCNIDAKSGGNVSADQNCGNSRPSNEKPKEDEPKEDEPSDSSDTKSEN